MGQSCTIQWRPFHVFNESAKVGHTKSTWFQNFKTMYPLLILVRISALLVVAPLGLATLFTAATSVPLGVPFNFANVIVIPLLLGMGVDTGIHLVHRYRSEALPGGNLLRTATARAVLLSSLTTVASFGTLGLSTHLGMASLGQLLALGICLILLCNLVILPALLQVTGRGR